MITLRDIEKCPVCGSTDRRLIYASTYKFDASEPVPSPYSAHYQINDCTQCGMRFSSPILNDDGVRALYEHGSEANVADGEEENVRRTMRGYYDLAKPHLPAKKRVLDIGCDLGFLLEAAKQDGFEELFGIEPVTPARERVEQTLGATVSDQFYEDTEYPRSSFDLISLIHVLDHLVHPAATLPRLQHDLKPGGIAIAVVHNIKSPLGTLLGERFPVLNLYHHYFFSKKSLRELFENHGFEVISVVSTKNCYSLRFFAERVPLLPEALRRFFGRGLDWLRIGNLPVYIPVGNIGVVARRPYASSTLKD